jgi:hypothetical protein
MSDNLINLIKSALFQEAVTVTTDGGDISPVVIQPTQTTGQDKYNLDQRDSLSVLLFSDLGTITAGATITAKYYARFPNATTDSKLLSTEKQASKQHSTTERFGFIRKSSKNLSTSASPAPSEPEPEE